MGFNTSLSGIKAANSDLNVTANNIANVNTTGFKESRAEFADLFSATGYGLARNAIGAGVRVSNVAQQFSQGNVDPTGRNLDMAISGDGFFTLTNNGAKVYSRAGNFQTDDNGYVVNPQGAKLQVFPPAANGNGFAVGTLTDLQLLTTDSSPKQSETVSLMFTLPGNAKTPTVATFSPSDANSYNHSTGGITVYDSLGVSHTQTSYFVKTGNANEWQVHNYVDGTAVGTTSTIQFDGNGKLTTPADGRIALSTFTPSTGAGTLNLTLDVSGSTQYGEAFALRDARQDGYASGKLNSISIDANGVVFARYSNNADKALGQVAMTNFVNPQGLSSLGDNVWAESSASGNARTGAPGTSDFGSVQSGALEASTVDLTEQLVNMIVAQRNFQANSQMISTQDQVTQTIINIR
ncbi:flagellar hook protein FlgE [Xanthomonas translucens]|uniref:Flagellar hook protein FlgE n=3 Tax=Xanthomonas campestris pv. translucens TaxID=343 RepID=A0A109HPQ2_XANCT|nr:flagellar hook protein FlgE [Xanthomonas translucens]KWV16228.1 flagellar biosynthesis protein FlgE [Xanthomonas translucens]MCC8445580.1 flagellar hook protein FlgE [Xanthomonas translucens pv. translucens]MCT8285707.1 flagellar hook protein FlgE [Xanthomonas translucens pv. translucens]MCT8303365.1 flagellar hook protein FlgE [Xanthomonas translucens pv. translucens]QSQ29042.1 flagellar hook protein FlgE [Xanthomonas translucens pv. translucens]